MDIIICGAGDVGSHAAEVLAAAGSNITVIDRDAARLRELEETLDIATLVGNGAEATVLRDAGCDGADMLVAATDSDEVNLLAASMAKGLGASKSVARVHQSAFFERRGLDYGAFYKIDRLICPEYATALAIARTIRNPGAVAIESFARGRIEMQQFTAQGGSALGKRLMDVRLPPGSRLALIRRDEEAFIPEATSVVVPGDSIILVGNTGAFQDARKLFQEDRKSRTRVAIMGGPAMAEWLCATLRDRSISVRVFEKDRVTARRLAEKLDHVTVIQADPTDPSVFAEENLAQADFFVAMLGSDESNIIAGVLAKTRGVERVVTVVQQSKYLDIAYDIGIDFAFSTRLIAGEEIEAVLDESPLRLLGVLAEGNVDVYRVRLGPKSTSIGKPLRSLNLSPDWVVAAVQRDDGAHVPGADDTLERGDVVLVVGRHDAEDKLRKIFGSK